MLRKYIENIVKETIKKEQKKLDNSIKELTSIKEYITEAEKRGKVILMTENDTDLFKKLVSLVNKEPDLHIQLITKDNAKLDIWVPENRNAFHTTKFTGEE